MIDLLYYLIPLAFVAVMVKLHVRSKVKISQRHSEVLKESVEAGLTEPPSLHPVVDTSICMGSGACVTSCPEHALGVINGKGLLINASHCIGHGACAPACPVGAIKLVFGTTKRGMDIPIVKPDFETNVPGVFIAGELGGMGLIRKAVEQGKQAVANIIKKPKKAVDFDLVIIGSGPAGISASLAAQQAGLRYVTVEQEDSLGGTTYHYPRNKLVMTAPMDIPLVGRVSVREISKESLMELWLGIFDKTKPDIRFNERMEDITPEGDHFLVKTSKDTYRAGYVLLAIGRRGTPRKLGVDGENQPKVVYRLIEAEQYRGRHVLVVGGGDSALEAALDVSAEAGTKVTLSYRGNAFNRVKPKNRARVDEAQANEKLDLILESEVGAIGKDYVDLLLKDERVQLDNDAIIVCAGGELPTPFLKKIGVVVETKFGS